jgi:cysteine desulfurase
MAYSSLRFSLGRFTTAEEIDLVTDAVTKMVKKLREMSPLWQMHREGVIPAQNMKD